MFKKIVFLFAILICLSDYGIAQNLIFLDSQNNNVNGQTITLSNGDLNTTHIIHLGTKNISGSYMNVKVKRYELNVQPNTQNYFCWANCYAPADAGEKPVWTDPYNVGMTADSVYDKFSAYYTPNGIAGTSSFRYILFDVNNPDDSSFVDIVFDISVGITQISNLDYRFQIYPNPVKDILYFNNNISENIFEIYTVSGEKVHAGNIQNSDINLSFLNEGIYFLALKSGDKIMATKKFIMSQ